MLIFIIQIIWAFIDDLARELLFVWNEVKNIIVIKKYLIAFFIYSSRFYELGEY